MEETLPEWIDEEQVGKYEREPQIEQNLGTRAERHHEHLMIATQAKKTLEKYHQW
jgi:hypothetical protein